MKILAVDTATVSCGVGVIDGDALLAETITTVAETHSKHLMRMVDLTLNLAQCSLSDIDGFAITIGPGSFTGIRIGLSTVKGLAFASGKPLTGVSTLDVLASQCALDGKLICSMLDARKSEVYLCFYRYRNEQLAKEGPEIVIAPAAALKEIREPCIFNGDGAGIYREVIKAQVGEFAHFADAGDNVIRAATVARLGLKQFSVQATADAASLVPHYIRKSDAELKFGAGKG